MHARLENLISLRDRQPVDAATAAHVAACTDCTAELRRLTALRSDMTRLPAYAPPELWNLIAARLAAAPTAGSRWRWANIAAAGSIAALVLALAASLPQLRVGAPAVALPSSARAPLAQLVERSQRLEAALRQLPQRPAVEVVANSAAIDALQSRIQRLDLELADETDQAPDHDHLQQLWGQRVSLLNSLVGVRYAEAVHTGYRAAH